MNGYTRKRRGLRRVLGLSLGSAMVMAMAPGVASAQTQPDAIDTSAICGDVESNFDDIAGSAHEYNVRCMADFGLTEGLAPDGTSYGPRLDVTRGQMASFIARFIEDYDEQELPPGDPTRFDDVPATDAQYVHATNIHKLAAIEVVEGTNASDGQSYAPQANVTRGQMASFIRRALSYLDNGSVNPLSEPPAGADAFPDDDGSVHEANINSLAGVRIVEGFDDGDYRPLNLVKRDQMASFVMRAYAWAVDEGLGDSGPVLLSSVPEDGDTDVPIGTDVTGEFDRELAADSRVELACDDVDIAGDSTVTDDTLVFDPTDDLDYAAECEAALVAVDAEDDTEVVWLIAFTTEDSGVTLEIDGFDDGATVGVPEAFDVTATNERDEDVTGVEANFVIDLPEGVDCVGGDAPFTIRYDSSDDETPDTELPLACDDGQVTGRFGPEAGFPVAANSAQTSYFDVDFDEAGDYSTTITLDEVAEGGRTLATATVEVTVGAPA